MSTRVFLIRHGITAANLKNIFAGRTDEPLHDQGKQQLSEVAKKLQKTGVDQVYCGPLDRTWMSAEIIGKVSGAPIEINDAFNEIDIPHWDGLTKDQIREEYGPEYPTWLESPNKFSVPNCETLDAVQRRAVKGIEEIFANHSGQNIVVVSHLIVVRCLILYYRAMPISSFRSIKISNASITELFLGDDGAVKVIFELQEA